MNRVTKERVEAARLKNEGIKLNPGSWARSYNGIQCMCALSHVAAAEGDLTFEQIHKIRSIVGVGIETLIMHTLDISEDYLNGYVIGFDGSTLALDPDAPMEDLCNGYKDGRAARELLSPMSL
jgi:hypothetical protein